MVLHADEPVEPAGVRFVEELGELPGRHAGRAEVEHLALVHELAEGIERFLDGRAAVVAVNLVEIDVVRPKAAQRPFSMACRTCLRAVPRSLGVLPVGLKSLLAITTCSRGTAISLSARPSTSSLAPSEYMSAVSKKFTPASWACLKNGSAAS